MNQEKANYQIPEETKVGKKLSDLTTRRVIILVLAMMFSVPLFDVTTYIDNITSYEFGLSLIQMYDNPKYTSDVFNFTINQYINLYSSGWTPIVSLLADQYTWNSNTNLSDLRSSEQYNADVSDYTNPNNPIFISSFDLRKVTMLDGGLGISRTLFVCIVLSGAALIFIKDSNDLIIGPIELMIKKINRIAENPLNAAQEEEEQAVAIEQAEQEKIAKRNKNKFRHCYDSCRG